MQTVSPPPTGKTTKPKNPPRIVRKTAKPKKPVSYAPVGLAALLVIAFFVAVGFVIATDDVARLVETLSTAGWVLVGLGLALGLGVVIRRGKLVLGLGWISALVLLVAGGAVVYGAPQFTGPAHYSQGQQAFADHRYEQAVNEYSQAGNPDYFHKEIPEAYLKWGDQLAKAGQFEQALAQYDKVTSPQLQPNPFAAQVADSRAQTWLTWADKIDKANARAWSSLPADQRQKLENDLLVKYDAALAQNPSPTYANPAKSGARNVLYRQAEELKAQSRYEDLDAVYQKVADKYLDGRPQTLSELENRRAANYVELSHQLSQAGDYNTAISDLQKAETRLAKYDPRRLDTVYPDLTTAFNKLAPQLINDGKYDEAVNRLETALRDYGPKDPRNLIPQALLNSYIAYGDDLKARDSLTQARDRYKQALDLNGKYNFKDDRPQAGLGQVYLAMGQEATQKNDFNAAIAVYREGLNAKYFNPAETNVAIAGVAQSYFSWEQQYEQNNDLDKALATLRDGLTTNGFDPTTKDRATDQGGSIFLKQADAAQQRQDLQGAINIYATLAADPQFKTSAASKNLINVAPKVMFTLGNQYIQEANTPDPANPDKAKLVKARDVFQNLVNTYGSSDFGNQAKGILTAQVPVVGKLLNNQGNPLGGRPVQLATSWKQCTASTPADDSDCKGQKDGFVATGSPLGFLTAPDGGWAVKLDPGKKYVLFWQERGKFISAFVNGQPDPSVTLNVEPMIPLTFEYRTPTDSPQ